MKVELTRTVRLALNGPGASAPGPCINGYSAWPAIQGLARFYTIDVHCRGPVDPVTGYFINIKTIDAAVRQTCLPYLESQLLPAAGPSARVPMGRLMHEMLARLQPPLNHTVVSLSLNLSPFLSLRVGSSHMHHVTVRQQFEFSAAHRLHAPGLSDEQNRQTFGKCNNPSGHGHNYRVETAIRVPVQADGSLVSIQAIDELVDDAVIQKLDHKHLNIDVPAFASLNPSVENIARVVWDMLAGAVGKIGGELEEVKVWETEKTVATYRASLADAER